MKRTERLTTIAAAVTLACSSAAFAGQQQNDNQQSAEETASRDSGISREYQNGTGSGHEDMTRAMTSKAQPGQALTDEIVEENNLGDFRRALEKSGIAGALGNGQDYTLFAPTDDAFAALDKQKAAKLMEDGNVEELRKVLRSHIVSGKVDASQAKSIKAARVLTGETVPLSVRDDKLHVANATVVKSDIRSGNLTIHAIDEVIDVDSAMAADDEEEAGE